MHDECLTSEAKRLFPKLRSFSDYTLVGGTALALQIGHRLSYDFDLFTEQALAVNLSTKVKKVFSGEKIRPSFKVPEQYDLFVSGVKITFRHYPYHAVHASKRYKGVPLLSIKDIGASKAFAIGQRAAYRDYIDVYFILAEGHATLGDLIHIAKKKYGDEFNGRLFLEQLVYFGDISDTKVEFLRPAITEKELISALKKEVRAYMRAGGL